jgi:hypothetical protein
VIHTGSRVKYVRKDGFYDRQSGFYPHCDTLGTVVAVHPDGYEVRWDKGTRNGVWYVNRSDVKEVKTTRFISAISTMLTVAAIGVAIWAGISYLEIIATNLPDNQAVPSAWNLFSLIFGK